MTSPSDRLTYFGVGSVLHVAFPDGRVARLVSRNRHNDGGFEERWEAVPMPSMRDLWPEPAPVADAKPAVRWLNRSTWWCDDCQAAHGAEIPICFCGTRRPTPTP